MSSFHTPSVMRETKVRWCWQVFTLLFLQGSCLPTCCLWCWMIWHPLKSLPISSPVTKILDCFSRHMFVSLSERWFWLSQQMKFCFSYVFLWHISDLNADFSLSSITLCLLSRCVWWSGTEGIMNCKAFMALHELAACLRKTVLCCEEKVQISLVQGGREEIFFLTDFGAECMSY